jgi:hypothetical protein
MQGYNKSRYGPFIPVHYNCYVEASMLGSSKGSMRPSHRSIIMA